MPTFRKLLCPTDFSEGAQQALTQAALIAGKFGSEIHLLHAIEIHKADPYNPAYHFPETDEIWQRLRQIATSEMDRLVKPYAESLEIHKAQERGIAAGPVILDYAEKYAADLIVMGTQGLRGPRRFFLGSVTEEVMRSSRCPVLILPQPAQPSSVETIRNILVPVDFSENSKAALSLAREVAQTLDAHLHLVHVLEARHYVGYFPPTGDTSIPEAEKVKGVAKKRLRTFSGEAPGAAEEFHVVIGHAASEILALASKIEAHLIVIGSQGFSPLQNLIFGSTAEGVARQAECAVLTVKEQAQDAS